MRIESAELRLVALPLIAPWRTAYGSDDVVHSVLVRFSGGGVDAWAESSPLRAPTYSPETARSVFENCREHFLPRLRGQELNTAQDVLDRLAAFRGNPFAKAALEIAWWALHSQQQGQPLWRALGGTNPVVRCGADFGVQDTIDELLALVQQAVAAGYPRIKLKVCRGWDLEVVGAVRAAFPAAVVHVDCNGGYDLGRDRDTLKALDRFNLAMIEQPLHHADLVEHAELQRQLNTPICLDESVNEPRDFRLALKLGACRAINVKPARVGGLTNAIMIHDWARAAEVTAWVGGMLESGLGVGICAALATLPGFNYPADIFPSTRFYRQDISRPWIELDGDHCLRLPDRPGVGFEPDLDRLEAVTVHRAVW